MVRIQAFSGREVKQIDNNRNDWNQSRQAGGSIPDELCTAEKLISLLVGRMARVFHLNFCYLTYFYSMFVRLHCEDRCLYSSCKLEILPRMKVRIATVGNI